MNYPTLLHIQIPEHPTTGNHLIHNIYAFGSLIAEPRVGGKIFLAPNNTSLYIELEIEDVQEGLVEKYLEVTTKSLDHRLCTDLSAEAYCDLITEHLTKLNWEPRDEDVNRLSTV
jgi:hypothetical protein